MSCFSLDRSERKLLFKLGYFPEQGRTYLLHNTHNQGISHKKCPFCIWDSIQFGVIVRKHVQPFQFHRRKSSQSFWGLDHVLEPGRGLAALSGNDGSGRLIKSVGKHHAPLAIVVFKTNFGLAYFFFRTL